MALLRAEAPQRRLEEGEEEVAEQHRTKQRADQSQVRREGGVSVRCIGRVDALLTVPAVNGASD